MARLSKGKLEGVSEDELVGAVSRLGDVRPQ